MREHERDAIDLLEDSRTLLVMNRALLLPVVAIRGGMK